MAPLAEEESHMKFLNRIALIIKPRQPLLDWLHAIGAEDLPSLEELRDEASLYLVDEPTEEQPMADILNALIDAHWQKIFQNELSIWDEFGDHHPSPQDRPLFLSWFDVSLSGLTFDMASSPLMVADVDEM